MNDHLFPQDECVEPATIEAIDPAADDPNFRIIRVTSQPDIHLPAGDVESLELCIGQIWTNELALQVDARQTFLQVQKRAMKLLGRKPHSRVELQAKLLKKCDDAVAVDSVLDDLVEHGWLDDRAVAEQLVQEQMKKGAASREFLMNKLRVKKIDSTLAGQVVDELLSEVDQFDAAIKLAERELARLTDRHSQQPLQPEVAIRRISSTLTRRGFDSEMVESVVHRLNLAADSFD